MIFEPFPEFLPSEYRVKFATEPWERRDAAALRRRVFCDEQKIFSGDDRDATDDVAIPIVALSSFAVVSQEVVGTVRIHRAEPGVWWGSRLAVAGSLPPSLGARHLADPPRRLFGPCARLQALLRPCAGAERAAVSPAGLDDARGEVLHGHPHHFMQADLGRYPPIADAEVGFLSLPKAA